MARKLIKFITLDEFKALVKAEKIKEYKLAYVLGFGSGLRISEIIGYDRGNGTKVEPLRPENVNLDAHQIKVVSGKGNKDRVTVCSQWVTTDAIKLLPLNLTRRALQQKITRLGKKVLGKDISFHCLRHGFGNYMVNVKNVPMPLVQSLMGHSRIDTTGVYTKANPVQAIDKAWDAWN